MLREAHRKLKIAPIQEMKSSRKCLHVCVFSKGRCHYNDRLLIWTSLEGSVLLEKVYFNADQRIIWDILVRHKLNSSPDLSDQLQVLYFCPLHPPPNPRSFLRSVSRGLVRTSVGCSVGIRGGCDATGPDSEDERSAEEMSKQNSSSSKQEKMWSWAHFKPAIISCEREKYTQT